MFAENWKISLRQIKRLLILDLFGLSSLLLPGILARMDGGDGIFCLAAGLAGGAVLLLVMKAVLAGMKRSYYEYLKYTVGQLLADIFMVFYFLYFVTLSGFVLYQEGTLILTWLLPEGHYWLVAVLLLLLAGYAVKRGIEGRARVYEILFWFLGIPLILMLLLALGNVNPDRWTPLVHSSPGGLLRGSLAAWIFLLPLVSLLFLKPFCRKPEKLVSCGKLALFTVTAVNAVLYLILIGVFGQHTMQVLSRPVITLMSMVNLPGGLFTRQDVIMTAVWFFALFALLNTGIFQGNLILKELCQTRKNSYTLPVVLILSCITAAGLFQNQVLLQVFAGFQKWMALPGMLGIPLAALIAGRIRGGKRKGEENVR